MPVNDGQERVTAFQMDLQLFAEGEGGGEAAAVDTGAESTASPLDTLYDMKPIDGFAEEAGESETPADKPEDKPAPAKQEEAIPDEVKKEQSPEANEAFKKMRQENERLAAEITRRDEETAKRFGNQGIKNFDDLVKGWDTALQLQAEQQTKQVEQQAATFDQQFNAVIQYMQAQGFDENTIAARADAMIANHKIQQLELKLKQDDDRRVLEQKQIADQNEQTQKAANIEKGTQKMLSDYEALRTEYGDLLPEIKGDTPQAQLESMWSQLDDSIKDKVLKGYSLEDAVTVSHKADILASASKKGAQQTLNQVNGRAHLKPTGGTSEVETVAIPEETLKMYKQLNPGKTHKEYLEHYKRSMKG